jgi:hypothetical protein
MTVTETPPTAVEATVDERLPAAAPAGTPAPPPVGDAPETEDTRPPVADLIRPVLAAALATAAAGLVAGGIFGSWSARISGLVGGLGGAFWVLLSLRSRRTNLLVAVFPIVAIAAGAFSLVLRGESPGDLPRLVGDAIDAGRLFRPPVPYDAGWTPILVVLMAVIGFACAWIGTALDRAKIAVAIPIPIAGLTAITQPDNQQVLAGMLAFFPILAALAVLFGGNADRARGLGGAFELKRAARAGAAAVPLLLLLVLLSRASFLFPEPVYDPTDQPQKPKPIPLSAARDRVLFEVETESGLTGPWRSGVLDVYDDDGFWKSSPRQLKSLPSGGRLNTIRAGDTQQSVQITVRDLGDSPVLPTVGGATAVVFAGGAPGQTRFDPRTQLMRMETGRVPVNLVYTLSLPAYATNEQLAAAVSADNKVFADQLKVPKPPAIVRDLIRTATPTPWGRLDALRQKLLATVTAKGTGTPVAITAARVEKMFKDDATASPYEIVAAEALLARWAGVPARIGFGFDGLNAEEKLMTVRPRNSAQWLEVYFGGYGWLPLVGTPQKAAQDLETDPNARFNPTIAASDDVAVEVFLPFEIKEAKQLYQRVRDLLINYLPLVATGIAGFIVWPFFSKSYRRGKRRRWATELGPRAQIAVEYAEFRDMATDLNVADIYSTPLEYLLEVIPDPEHAEFAWLTARALYGDMRAATESEVLAAERLGASLRRRLLRGQPVPVQIGALISRASIKQPYTTEVPNIRLVQLPRLRPRLRLRMPTIRVPRRALARR